MNDTTTAWRVFVERKIEKSEQKMLRLVLETVGQVLGEERKHRIALEAEVAKVRAELEQERGSKLRAVPPAKIA